MFANYNSYSPSGTPEVIIHPYMSNQSFPTSGTNDFTLEDSICTEFYLLYGSDVTFIPKELYKEDTVFGEYLSSTYDNGYKIRIFVEEVEAWSGNGDMYSKFGLQVTDEATMWINKTFWLQQTNNIYPKQGDLLYHHVSQKLFSINHIENEIQNSFYRLGNLGGYKIQCKLFSYNHEKVDNTPNNGIPLEIQALDSLLNDLTGNRVTLPEKEFNQNNKPIIDHALHIIDKNETDPLG